MQQILLPLGHNQVISNKVDVQLFADKGNNKITELRTILQRESQNS
jgi:hypothetical protein